MVKAIITISNRAYTIDLAQPIDISIPFVSNKGVVAYGAKPYNAKPFSEGGFVGSLESGSPVNFYDIELNPHGNGTHTESMLHIDSRGKSIHDTLKQFHHLSYLTTVDPVLTENGDYIVKAAQLDFDKIKSLNVSALIIRTLPNPNSKKSKNYTSNNPPYLERTLITELNKTNVLYSVLFSRKYIRCRKPKKYRIEGVDEIYCGHTIIDIPQKIGNINYIDTGAFSHHNLTLIELQN